MDMSKKITILLLAIALVIGGFGFADAIDVSKTTINGESINFENAAYTEGDSVYVPLREISVALNATVSWESKTKEIKVVKDDKTILFKLNNPVAKMNGKLIVMSSSPIVKDGTAYVPLYFISKAFGVDTDYIKSTNSISIKDIKSNDLVELKYATGFTIDNLGNDVKLVVDGSGKKMLLVPREQEIPKGYENIMIVRTPIKNVLLASTTQACALNALDELDSIGGVTTDTAAWYINGVKSRMEEGKIQFVGSSYSPDFEVIQKLNPEIAFVYTGSYPQTAVIEKLKELDIPYVVNNEYMEASSLGRLEWMKLEAAFYNKDKEANEIFEKSVKEIEALKESVKDLEKPRVAWGSVYKGVVYTPRAGSYVAEMIEAAGGDYLFKDMGVDETGSAALSLEEFFAKVQDADVLIYSSSNSKDVASIIDAAPIFEELKVIQDANVWCFHPSWYQTIDKTADKYRDLANILYPENIEKSDSENYIKLEK
jgi:iron complex transport system substrate-binding protein